MPRSTGQRGECLGHLLVVGAVLGLDRQAEHRLGEVHRLQVDVAILLGVVQYVVEVHLLDFGHRADVAGDATLDLDVLLALQIEQVAHLERLARVADIELGLPGQHPLVDAEDAELAGIRVAGHLEHVGEHVLVLVGLGMELPGILLADVERRWVALHGIRHQLDDDVEEFPDTGAGARRDKADRHQVTLAQRLLERVVQLLGGQLLTLLEVELHQLLVDLDDLVDQGLVRLGNR
jgi:hypothetical protein